MGKELELYDATPLSSAALGFPSLAHQHAITLACAAAIPQPPRVVKAAPALSGLAFRTRPHKALTVPSVAGAPTPLLGVPTDVWKAATGRRLAPKASRPEYATSLLHELARSSLKLELNDPLPLASAMAQFTGLWRGTRSGTATATLLRSLTTLPAASCPQPSLAKRHPGLQLTWQPLPDLRRLRLQFTYVVSLEATRLKRIERSDALSVVGAGTLANLHAVALADRAPPAMVLDRDVDRWVPTECDPVRSPRETRAGPRLNSDDSEPEDDAARRPGTHW